MDRKSELKDRIDAKQMELRARIKELQANSKGTMNDQIDSLKKEVEEVQELLKDGWESVTENVAKKLNEWLKKN